MRRYFLCVLAAGAAFIGAHTNAQAQFREVVAGWEIHALNAGQVPACYMTTPYQDGTEFMLIVYRDAVYAIGLKNPAWGLREGDSFNVTARVDGRTIANGTSNVIPGEIAIVPLAGVEAFRSLMSGRRLDLVTSRGKFDFMLTGTSRAMTAVVNCASTLPATVPQQPQQAQQAQVTTVSSAQAMVLLTNLLNGAQIRDYTLHPPAANDPLVSFSRADGSSGTLFAVEGQTMGADEAASTTIGLQSQKCTGEYLSGKQSFPSTDGSTIRKVAATCRVNGQGTVEETLIVRKANGLLIYFTTYRKEGLALGDGGAGGAAGGNESQSLVDAAMRLSK